MSNQTISVAYCSDNEATVKSLIEPLNNTSYSFQYLAGNRSTNNDSLAEQLLGINQPILLFISDNFLKSAQCMSRALKLLHEKRQYILPIIIDGVTKDDNTGETISVQTDFDRVSDIIQYINYWQDQYLDLRRQRRQIEGLDEEKFNAHLMIMREISSEAGEFLRLLRSMIYLNKIEFQSNHYEQFFLLVDDNEGWRRFKAANPGLSPSIELEVEDTDTDIEDTTPPVDISEIPGADMLGLGEEAPSSVTETAESAVNSSTEDASSDDNDSDERDLGGAANIEVTPDEEIVIDDLGPINENDREAASIIDAAVDSPMEEQPTPVEETNVVNEEVEEAKEEIDTAVEANRLVQEAADFFNQGQDNEGMNHLAQAVEKYPDNAYLKYHYALFIAQKTENYTKAISELEPVLDLEPENGNAVFLLGELSELEGDFKKARGLYERLLAIDDEYPDANYRLGMIIASHYENEAELAGEYFEQAIEQDASNQDARYQYALLLSVPLGKPKKGIKLLKKIIKENPNHPFASYDLALIYHSLGKLKKAHKAYTKAISINPELQTEENDLAFAQLSSEKGKETQIDSKSSSISFEAIESLKSNIEQLEEMLQYSESERSRLKSELKETEEKTIDVPKIDQTVLITGATSGIGKAIAERFAQAGYRVIITGRRANRLAAIQERLATEYQAEVHTLAFDVRDTDAIHEAINSLEGPWADIDILINNAGKAKGLAPIHEGQIEHWEEMIDTNLKGLLYVSRVVSPLMVKRQKGHIINICSTAGKEVYPNGNVYCATKFAVDALTKSMRMDLFKHHVRVSMVSPAHVDETEFALVRFDGDAGRANIYNDFKPLSSPDVADSVFFIASQPRHVNILDVVMQGTQQAHSMLIDRSGRALYEEE